jgi:hypothetical protein
MQQQQQQSRHVVQLFNLLNLAGPTVASEATALSWKPLQICLAQLGVTAVLFGNSLGVSGLLC